MHSAPVTPSFFSSTQACTNTVLVFGVFISCLCCAKSLRLHVQAHAPDCQSGILTDGNGNEEKRAKSQLKTLKHLQTRKQRSTAYSVASWVIYRKSKTGRGPAGALEVGAINQRVPEVVEREFWLFRLCCVQGGNNERNQRHLQHFKTLAGIMFVLKRATATGRISTVLQPGTVAAHRLRRVQSAHKG